MYELNKLSVLDPDVSGASKGSGRFNWSGKVSVEVANYTITCLL